MADPTDPRASLPRFIMKQLMEADCRLAWLGFADTHVRHGMCVRPHMQGSLTPTPLRNANAAEVGAEVGAKEKVDERAGAVTADRLAAEDNGLTGGSRAGRLGACPAARSAAAWRHRRVQADVERQRERS